jgi:hypothetical protein
MSDKDLLWNQYRYPLPAPAPFFTFQFNTNAIPLSPNSQYVFVSGIPNPATYGITNPILQVSMILGSVGNNDLQLCGYQDYNPVAGTLAILVNNITNANSSFLIMVAQSTEV